MRELTSRFLSENRLVLIFLLISLPLINFSQTLVINEFMASNLTTIADEDGDFSDWIELYNNHPAAINLDGYHLSDNADIPQKWTFPAVTIQPGDYLLIWASGKDKTDPGSPLHTNFSISASGEVLLLSDPSEILLDSIPEVELETDFSRGRQPDAGETFYFFAEPTPASSNTTTGYNEFLDRPSFSADGGFHVNPFDLVISHDDTTVQIIYTLDGSEPDENNLAGTTYQYKNQYPQNPGNPFGSFLTDTFFSYVYDNPIPITNQSQQPNDLSLITTTWHSSPNYLPSDTVFKGVVVRARAIKTGAVPSKIKTRTFFISPEGANLYSLPVVSFTTQETNLFDYNDGIYVAGVDFDEWRTNFPNSWPHGGRPANYHREGDEWEYPAYLEMFEPGEVGSVISQNVGFRIHGAYASANPMKALRIYARDIYGPATLDYKIFPELPITNFKRILIRNSGQDFLSNMVPTNMPKTQLKCGVLQAAVDHLHFDVQAYRPCIVFINGEYWGIHNIRERQDQYYLESHYGVDPNNIDILENDGEINMGDDEHYNTTINYIENNNLSDPIHYNYIKTRIDIENFTDFQIANIYIRNLDWPGNNLKYWRLQTPDYDPGAPYGHDGRWRWMMFDLDISISGQWTTASYTYNALERALDATGTFPGHAEIWSTFLLRKLMQNGTFQNDFINRCADLMNSTFLPERFAGFIEEKKQVIEPEMQEMRDRWNYPSTVANWESNVDHIIEFANKRPPYMRQHIMSEFGIADTVELTLNVSDEAAGYVRVNTIDINSETPGIEASPYPWTGIYFLGIPIELEAVANNGYAFSHWIGASSGGSAVIEVTPNENINLTAVFIPAAPTELIHYWLFDDNLPNDTPLEVIDPTYQQVPGSALYFHSALAGYPFYEGHPNWRKASLERRNEPTEINYRAEGNNNIPYDSVDMKGIQVKQPFVGDGGENIIYLHLPSTGYENLFLRFAAMDEGAADSLLIDYSTTLFPVWKTAGLTQSSFPVAVVYQLYELDFSNIPAVNNNSNFTVRIRFWGPDMTVENGDRVTFNNFSLDGRPFTGASLFYCKPAGSLNSLDTWGLNEDGSGNAPTSFGDQHQVFNIRNRETVILDQNWGVSGIGSRILIGNAVDSIFVKIPESYNLSGPVDVSPNAALEIENNIIPDLELISQGSTIIYSQNTDTTDIPDFNYGNLQLKNAVKKWVGHTTIFGDLICENMVLEVDETLEDIDVNLTGDLILNDISMMSDSCFQKLNIKLESNLNQKIDTDTNLVKCHNFEIYKSAGNVTFYSGLKTENHLNAVLSGTAKLVDLGQTLTVGNSIEFHGGFSNYELTGTLRFDGNDPAGPGANNQNIRGADNDFAPAAAFNNIELAGFDEKRFRPSNDQQSYTIKGNLIIDSTATDRIKFYQNRFNVGGDIIYNSSGSFEAGDAEFIADGDFDQNIHLIDTVSFRNLVLSKTMGSLKLDGHLVVLDTLDFNDGKIEIINNGLMIMGINSVILDYDEQRYIEGAMGQFVDNAVMKSFDFPVGKPGDFQPIRFEMALQQKDTTMIIVELFDENPPSLLFPPDLNWVSDLRYHRLEMDGNGLIDTSNITLSYNYQEFGFDVNLLRIAASGGDQWINLGGIATGGPKGTIISEQSLSEAAIIVLARYNDIAPQDQYLDLKLYLEGPYDSISGIMTNTLNLAGKLPLEQPFNKTPWFYNGDESVSAIPNASCVDWILIEFRDAVSAELAGPGTMFDRQAGFIKRDGSVVDIDGSSSLVFTGTGLENVFVVVWHRNHLGVISSVPVTMVGNVYQYDLSSGYLQALGSEEALKQLSTESFGLYAGDLNNDGQVDLLDKSEMWNQLAGESGYFNADINMDDQVDNFDKNIFWVPNLGAGSHVPE